MFLKIVLKIVPLGLLLKKKKKKKRRRRRRRRRRRVNGLHKEKRYDSLRPCLGGENRMKWKEMK